MNILIDIGHPAHVHLFKNFYGEMSAKGHKIHFTTRDKECSISLLKAYDLPFTNLGKPYKKINGKLFGLLKFGRQLFQEGRKNKTDLFLSVSSMYAAHASFLLNRPHICLDDTEHSKFEHMLYKPFSKYLLNPSCFEKEFGDKQVRYNGYHELAYLHPNRFQPNKAHINELGIASSEKFALLRFVSWDAAHDMKQGGLTFEQKIELVHHISKQMKVFISSEKELPKELAQFQIKIDPDKMHSVLNYATFYIGEGATMASECAAMGTPAIYVNTLNAGTLKDQVAFGLLHSFRTYDGVLDKTKELLSETDLQLKYTAKRDEMLQSKIDVTSFLVNFVLSKFSKS